jgi:hypothetical protein
LIWKLETLWSRSIWRKLLCEFGMEWQGVS